MLYYIIPVIISYPLVVFLWVCFQVIAEVPGIYSTLKECDTPDSVWNIFKSRFIPAHV